MKKRHLYRHIIQQEAQQRKERGALFFILMVIVGFLVESYVSPYIGIDKGYTLGVFIAIGAIVMFLSKLGSDEPEEYHF